jgi:uncharacterized protein YkwD
MHKNMRVFILKIALAIVSSIALPAFAQERASAAELKLLESANRARQEQGLPGLRWNDALAVAARKHAGVMAQHGSAEHGCASYAGGGEVCFVGGECLSGCAN